jgi:Chitobiase/beta-hexosaminidase C-terminal domain
LGFIGKNEGINLRSVAKPLFPAARLEVWQVRFDMRFLFLVPLLLSGLIANAQDPTQQIMMMQQQQAVMQATQQAQQAQQTALQAAQQANDLAMQAGGCCGAVAMKPRFSLKSGSYPSSTILRMRDRSRGAIIYYTTDGWTPTTNSTRYTGPITLSSNLSIQAIAVAPGCQRSQIASAVYTVAGSQPAALTMTPEEVSSLNRGTPLALTFTAAVTSKGLEVGDRLPIALARDLIVGGVLVAPKLTPVLATVLQVDHPGAVGAPGTLTFVVRSITLTDGEVITLTGTETMEGQPHIGKAESLAVIPFLGLGSLFIRGEPAQIPEGATLTAFVDADTALRAAR